MRYAKLETGARFNLASSGVQDCLLEDLGASWQDLALHGPNAYGYGPLVERIAARYAVPTACVVMPGGGCSFANHLALAALLEPGDEVLIEDPTYELLLATLGALSARTRTFRRQAQDGFRVDPAAVAAALAPATRVIVITDLHNPTGAAAGEADVDAVARLAQAQGALLLIDEVYRELTFTDGRVRTAFHPDGSVVVTSSLTKAYGLSGLRCGWILAPAHLAERMRRLNDLFGVVGAHVAERLAVVSLDHLPALRTRASAIVGANRQAYQALLGTHVSLEQQVFSHATTVFPRLIDRDADAFARRLAEQFDTCVTPGRFFGRPDSLRIGLGGDPETTREGLERMVQALST